MPRDHPADTAALLDEQKTYYRERSPEYDEWWLRAGRYDRGPRFRDRWNAETGQVRAALAGFGAGGRVLEIACGTGWWTPQLAAQAEAVTALDASPEMLRRCRERVAADGPGPGKVDYVQTDLWEWSPERRFAGVFFGFWLSHVPEERFDRFWELVDRALLPGGRVFFVDSAVPGGSSGAGIGRPAPDREMRVLNDGRSFEIFKRYFDPGWLHQRLGGIGWDVQVRRTAEFFLYAQGDRTVER